MTADLLLRLAFGFFSILLNALIYGVIASWVWISLRLWSRRAVLPEEPFVRLPIASWGLGGLIGVFLLWQGAGGVGFAIQQSLNANQQEAPPAEVAADDSDESKPLPPLLPPRELLIVNVFTNAFTILIFPWFFRRFSRGELIDLGLTSNRWGEQIQVGVVAGLLACPVVYLVQGLALQIWTSTAHPVQDMLEQTFDATAGGLAFLAAVVLAPIVEETIFRGLLQGWLTKLCYSPNGWWTRTETPFESTAVVKDNSICWPAVSLTSLLFAAVHVAQWPAPIALFVFAMILGAVYQKTGSLLTVIVMHSLFNGCSTSALLSQQLGRALELNPAVPSPIPAPALSQLLDMAQVLWN